MGYTTKFTKSITITPPLSEEEIIFLNKFSGTRRMDRKNGPYYVDAGGWAGQDHEEDIINYNQPPRGQPGLWCQWETNKKGTLIKWNGVEKFYDSEEWMAYIINHFIGHDPLARKLEPEKFSFLKGHILNGIIKAQGEERDDRWVLAVGNNQVKRFEADDLHFAEEFVLESKVPEIVNEQEKKVARQKKML